MKTPLDLEDLTLDQLYVMWLDVDSLRAGSPIQTMGTDQAVAAGLLASEKSLWQLAMEKKAAGAPAGMSRKQRRQRRREELIKYRERESWLAAEQKFPEPS